MPGAVVGCFGLAHGSHGRKRRAHLRATRPLPGRMWGVRGGPGALRAPGDCATGEQSCGRGGWWCVMGA
ncbi:hypothetical protein HMPREF1317_1213 [Schaalia georgiae F0490]|uniref:Uncharacterized protein n=1 Tax=Schaalia georgiae F0490 TaxID=1125717 RepID=J1H8Z6_9ACTO|nr:hypothetical protein HMPREF1317_1213 [Schaalia georgiae F0490]